MTIHIKCNARGGGGVGYSATKRYRGGPGASPDSHVTPEIFGNGKENLEKWRIEIGLHRRRNCEIGERFSPFSFRNNSDLSRFEEMVEIFFGLTFLGTEWDETIRGSKGAIRVVGPRSGHQIPNFFL